MAKREENRKPHSDIMMQKARPLSVIPKAPFPLAAAFWVCSFLDIDDPVQIIHWVSDGKATCLFAEAKMQVQAGTRDKVA